VKIAIVAPSCVPFLVGGAEKLWWGLLAAINQHTEHHAELIKLPSREQDFWELLDSYRAFSKLDLSHFDLIISTKYPAWMVAHPNHVCYLQHKLRGLYDTYHFSGLPTALPTLPGALRPLGSLLQKSRGERSELDALFTELERLRGDASLAEWFQLPSPLVRRVVHCLDSIGMAPSAIRRYLAISSTVAERADYFPTGVDVDVLHHPSDLPRAECTGDAHIFTASRLAPPKRLDLIIDAFRQVETERRLRIAGTGPAAGALLARAEGDPRIEFLGHISDAEIIREYGQAMFVPFVPYDEDYGLITLEAMRAAKPVLTTTDAGGVNELVEHQRTGLSVAAEPAALAAAMRQLLADPAAARAMGEAARRRVAPIDWPQTVATLLQTPESQNGLRRRLKVVVAVDFPIHPPRGGGQARVYHLYKALGHHADVTLVTLCDDATVAGRYDLAPGLVELRIAKSQAHLEAARRLNTELGVSANDIATLLYQSRTTAYVETLAAVTADCDLLIASHPYLYPSIAALKPPRLWYEAHNVECDMKRSVLGDSPLTAPYLAQVAEIERLLCEKAQHIMVCATSDATRFVELYQIDASKCLEVPNGVDTRSACLTDRAQSRGVRQRLGLDERRTAVFVGSWHQPNIEAAAALKSVAEQHTSVHFLVVGSVCSHPVLKNRPANLHALGMLGDKELDLLLRAVDVALNPVMSGSGTNLKMLHYAAAGVPILTTPFGNRGLAFADGKHIWCAELSGFPAALSAILTAPEDCARRALAARRLTEARYDWRAIAQRLFDAVGAAPSAQLVSASEGCAA